MLFAQLGYIADAPAHNIVSVGEHIGMGVWGRMFGSQSCGGSGRQGLQSVWREWSQCKWEGRSRVDLDA